MTTGILGSTVGVGGGERADTRRSHQMDNEKSDHDYKPKEVVGETNL